MLVVKFTRGYKSYIPGDVAGFDDKTADFLVSKGYAEKLGEVDDSETPPLPKGEFVFNTVVPKLAETICPVCGHKSKNKKGVTIHLWKMHEIKK